MNSYPHHLCRGAAQFTITEDGFIAITHGTLPPRQMQLNQDDAYDLARWLVEELHLLSKVDRGAVSAPSEQAK